TLDVRVVPLVAVGDRLADRARLLGRGGAVQVDQRVAVPGGRKDREVAADPVEGKDGARPCFFFIPPLPGDGWGRERGVGGRGHHTAWRTTSPAGRRAKRNSSRSLRTGSTL